MFSKITAFTIAAVAFVNAQNYVEEDRIFLNDFELY
jgi:hypothetical protein